MRGWCCSCIVLYLVSSLISCTIINKHYGTTTTRIHGRSFQQERDFGKSDQIYYDHIVVLLMFGTLVPVGSVEGLEMYMITYGFYCDWIMQVMNVKGV